MKIRSASTAILLASVLAGLLLSRCAHQGTLTGGPKDTDPPVLVLADPPERTTFFASRQARIEFNEFIQLKDAGKEIFISPPMREKPEFKVQGKKLVVEFREELKPNTTYTINFGNSIVDYTEGNPLSNFEYVFSTGEVIDSLSIPGKVLDAFNLAPQPGILAMVYIDDNDSIPLDSLPMKVPPKNAARTDKDGYFSINNLSPGEYKLFALEDLNSNFYFDLPTERIGFLDSLVFLVPEEKESPEEPEPEDSTGVSIRMNKKLPAYTMYLFEEIDSTQKLLGKKRMGRNRLQYYFKMPADSLEFNILDSVNVYSDWYTPEFSRNHDTIDLWLTPDLPDTIVVRTTAAGNISDTTRFILSQQERLARPKKGEVKGLAFVTNVRAGALDLKQDLKLVFGDPLKSFDTTRILLKSTEDSLSPSISYGDSIHRTVIIHHPWQPGETYRIIVDDSTFTDQEGLANDSTAFGFKVRKPEDYGILIMNISLPPTGSPYIIQLLDQKENILKESIMDKSGITRFDYLMPGKYKLKAIEDKDRNGRWSTGKYATGVLPELVQYYPDEIGIRANWDLQEDWKLQEK